MILDTYGRLELFGHICLYGHLSEEEVLGIKMCRIDVMKDGAKAETLYYGPSAIYCITPLDEQAVLEATRAPVRRLTPYAGYYDHEQERDDDAIDDDEEEINL